MGPPADVHVMRSRRLLRQLAKSARHRSLHRRAPSDHPVLRTRRGLVVLLSRRPRLPHRRRSVVRAPMSKGPAIAVTDHDDMGSVRIASSAVVVGTARLGERALVAEGAVIRSSGTGVQIGTGSAVLENSVIVGNAEVPTTVGRRTTFGHRCVVVGATVGDLCEIGNASILTSGARVGDRVFLGEGTLVPAGMTLPSDVVAVGRPARIIRTASAADFERLRGLRDGDLSIPPPTSITIQPTTEGAVMVGDVQIVENTLLHLLPDNELIIEDGAIAGPGTMIHGCHIG